MTTLAEASPATIAGSGALLDHLRSVGPATVTELAAAAGTARSTVVQRLELLIERHLVERVPAAPGARGRPAAQFRPDPSGGVVLAAQVGVTGARVAVLDLAGTVLVHDLVPVDLAAGSGALADRLSGSFDLLRRRLDRPTTPVVGCGIGVPADVELRRFAEAGSPWDRAALQRRLAEAVGADVLVDVEVNLMALAEQHDSWQDAEVFMCVKVGTLIDAAVVVRGEPVRGHGGLAGALGHVRVHDATGVCTCGGIGCLDTVASGAALVTELRSAGRDVEHAADVARLAVEGDPIATAALRTAGRRIGTALGAPVTLLAPRAIAVWGYLAVAEAPLFAGLREGLYAAALPATTTDLTIERAALGDLAGVRGAASRVLTRALEPDAVDRAMTNGSWAV